MYSFLTKKTGSFLKLIGKNINDKYHSNIDEFIIIEGVISGKLYFIQPKNENVKFTISKDELKERVKIEILEILPNKMFFV